ncbi:MAG: hypothetical protein WBC92_02340, partial [Terracidiphilus sp.]
MKTSPQTITLFTQQDELGPRPFSFAASLVLHCITIAVVLFGLAYRPPFTRVVTDHYSVRELDLHVPEQEMRAIRNSIPRPTSHKGSHALASAGSPSQSPPAPIPKVGAKAGPQTIIQA